jgi:hypothetical protein
MAGHRQCAVAGHGISTSPGGPKETQNLFDIPQKFRDLLCASFFKGERQKLPTQTIDPSTPPVPQPAPTRSPEYSREIGTTICERLIEGESLKSSASRNAFRHGLAAITKPEIFAEIEPIATARYATRRTILSCSSRR